MPTSISASPRPELIALLDAIKDNPDDDTPRLVLADWLDEQDNPLDAERAKFIRYHVTIVRGAKPSGWSEAEAAARRLDPLAPFTSGYNRGLPILDVDGPQFLKPEFRQVLPTEAFAFVQFVRLSEAGGPRMEAIAAMPEFRFVPGVFLHPFSAFGADSAARFFSSPNLTGLRRIEFLSVKPGAVGMQALANNPALGRLRKLELYHNKLVDKAVAALAKARHLAALTHLDLHDNNIGDKGAEALAASEAFPNLQYLDLSENPRLTGAGKQLLRDKFGDRVRLD